MQVNNNFNNLSFKQNVLIKFHNFKPESPRDVVTALANEKWQQLGINRYDPKMPPRELEDGSWLIVDMLTESGQMLKRASKFLSGMMDAFTNPMIDAKGFLNDLVQIMKSSAKVVNYDDIATLNAKPPSGEPRVLVDVQR